MRSFSNVLEGVDLEAMQMLVEPETIFASPEPIITAFMLGNQLNRLSMQQPERKLEYERLAESCEKLATDLLSGCRYGTRRGHPPNSLATRHTPQSLCLFAGSLREYTPVH